METNELPEDVKRKIEDAAVDRTMNQTKTNLWAIDMMRLFFKKGALFGYRLGLQSCEEQLKAKDEIIKYKDEVLYEWMQKAKAQSDEIKRLREALKECKDFLPFVNGDIRRIEKALTEIEALLTETKPE